MTNQQKQKAKKDPILNKKDLENIDKLIEEVDLSSLENIESNKEVEVADALKKDTKKVKLPVDRDKDKRRVWKWIKSFIDVKVPKKFLEWMPEAVQELMKKWKLEWKITQDELMAAIPNAEDDLDFLDDVFKRFMELNIYIVDNLEKDI